MASPENARDGECGQIQRSILTAVPSPRRKHGVVLGSVVVALLVACWVSRENYLLFHGFVELISVAVAWGVFLLVWNARRFIAHDAFAFLGLSLFFAGWLDLLHTLAYKGMGVLAAVHDANPATQLWIAARILATSGFLLFPFLLGRRLRLPLLAAGYGCVALLAAVSILAWEVFPDCFIEGHGLTLFKRVAEYALCMALAIGLVLLWRRRIHLELRVFRGIAGVYLVSMAAELCFTLYSDVYGVLNFTGHILKLLAAYLLYRSLIQASLTQPYATLFRELDQDHRELRRVEAELRQSIIERESDILCRKQVEKNLRFTQFVVDHLADAAFWMDSEGRFIYVNQASCDKLGYSREELLKMTVADIDPLFPRDAWPANWNKLREMKHHVFESLHKTRDGRIFPVEIQDNLIEIDGREFNCALVRDITDRKLTADELRKSETLFRNLFDLHAAVKLLIDPETGAIVDANLAAVTYYGWSRDEMRGMRIQEINTLSPGEVAAEMQRAKDAHRSYFEFRHRRADGSIRDVAVFSSNVSGVGKPLLHSIIHDITERKQADAALHAALCEKTALLKEVHHRVKNNLQIVASLLSLQERRQHIPEAQDVLHDTRARVMAMALLHEVLYRSGNLATVDVAVYVERLCVSLLRTVGPVASRVAVTRDITPVRLPLEQAVPCGLIINELVVNALKHGYPDERHGQVRIEIWTENSTIGLRVSDDGAGLPDPLDIATLPTLGLRLVQDLARQLQGVCRMERRGGGVGGTEVTVVFPAAGKQDAGGAP